jgi:hypothetical protein
LLALKGQVIVTDPSIARDESSESSGDSSEIGVGVADFSVSTLGCSVAISKARW